jgi:hypothetical protein
MTSINVYMNKCMKSKEMKSEALPMSRMASARFKVRPLVVEACNGVILLAVASCSLLWPAAACC